MGMVVAKGVKAGPYCRHDRGTLDESAGFGGAASFDGSLDSASILLCRESSGGAGLACV